MADILPIRMGHKSYEYCKRGHLMSETRKSSGGNYCSVCKKEYQRNHKRIVSKEKQLRHHLRSKYGITLEERQSMVDAQGGICAICKAKLKSPYVDHDHDTGLIRGILCNRCNRALGMFEDDRSVLLNAVAYLDHFSNDETTKQDSVRGRSQPRTDCC
jgi:Recombination endonuclease VII